MNNANAQTVHEVNVVDLMSPVGLWFAVLKPQVWHFGCLGFWQPEVSKEGGAKYN